MQLHRILLLALLILPSIEAQDAAPNPEATPPLAPDQIVLRLEDSSLARGERRKLLLELGKAEDEAAARYLQEALGRADTVEERIDLRDALAAGPGKAGLWDDLKEALKPTREARERLHALGLVAGLDRPWQALVGALVRADEDAAFRNRGIRLLADAAPDAQALHELEAIHREGVPAVQAEVIAQAIRGWPITAIDRSLLLPQLTRQADPLPRQAALRALAKGLDRRFFKYCRNIRPKETVETRLTEWVTLAATFDDGGALDFMVEMLEESAPARADALVRAASTMGSTDSRRWFREKGAGSTLPAVRLATARHLLAQPEPEDLRLLLSLARSPDREIAIEAISGLARREETAVGPELAKLAAGKDPEIASEALRAYYEQSKGSAEATAVVLEAASESRSWQMRCAALDLLGPTGSPEITRRLPALVRHDKAEVRSAAYAAATFSRDKATIELLLSRIEAESGRTSFDLIDALSNLTGFDWGRKPERWFEWWNKVKGDFQVPPRPPKRRSSGEAAYGRFYDIEIRSNRVVFIIDCSGSMDSRVKDGRTRLQQAKQELTNLVDSFNSDVKFNLIAFDTGFRPWSKRLQPGTPDQLQRARTWIGNLAIAGATNINDTLEFALDIEEVDTIVLLSDGGPSAGRTTNMDEIARAIQRRNRFRRIRIDTIGIGLDARTRNFLERLARENFGESRSF